MTNRSIVFLTACTLAGLALLIGLGVWQLKRLAWKEGLIAEIETRAKGEPIALKDAIAVASEGRDPSYYRRAGRRPLRQCQGALSLFRGR